MPTRFLILGNGLKPQKATKQPTAFSKATTMAMENPGVEIHLYQLHTSLRQDLEPGTQNQEPDTPGRR
jgi:hypothetical protein